MRDLLAQSPDFIEHASVAGPISTLVLAEIARLEGDHMKAVTLYDKAIALSQVLRFVQYEALAHHLLALHLGRLADGGDKSPLAARMMRTAIKRYSVWGAWAVVRRLSPAPPPPSSPRVITTAPLQHRGSKPKVLSAGNSDILKSRKSPSSISSFSSSFVHC